jgi:hypothetical protein
MTMAISTPGRRPSRMERWMARKLDPRPESRMPRRTGVEVGVDGWGAFRRKDLRG